MNLCHRIFLQNEIIHYCWHTIKTLFGSPVAIQMKNDLQKKSRKWFEHFISLKPEFLQNKKNRTVVEFIGISFSVLHYYNKSFPVLDVLFPSLGQYTLNQAKWEHYQTFRKSLIGCKWWPEIWLGSAHQVDIFRIVKNLANNTKKNEYNCGNIPPIRKV